MKRKRLNWNRKEDVFLIENYQKYIASELHEKFNQEFPHRQRSSSSISQRLLRLNLKKRRRWTDKEIEYLIDRIGQVSIKEISKYLHRTVGAVRKKLSELGISLKDELSDSLTEIANKINCSANVLYSGVKDGRLACHGRTNKVSGAYLISVQDVRKFIVKYYSDRWFKCLECGKDVLGDIYTKDCIPAGFKKQKPDPVKLFKLGDDHSQKFIDVIERKRLIKKISPKTLSNAIGYNDQWYNSYKKGNNKTLNWNIVQNLANELDLNIYIHIEDKR